ncbi:hypothetical protein RD792_000941 [Penstemon davidsonii]|uniref:C3H1-type domain-containing protein n=1 Tax=Penstemon davidsonii TaxID=160366 RepID=A0ABR0DM29_9LAMI|nr:hypothetical protein RD792_000941 [Penstemon davidsonii]
MGRSKKSKRVAWASDVNLCQVRLFLLEESPSQVGKGVQDHLQAKALWTVQSGGIGSDDNLPPGFEGIQPANLCNINLSKIPLMKWKCPRRFEVNSNWRVVAGEESAEAESQNQREMRVLEAIYPRPSAIPPNPSALLGIEDSSSKDQNIPVVPITPVEDEDAALDTSFVSTATNGTAMIPQSQNLSNGTFSSQGSATIHPPCVTNGISVTGMEPDMLAAAQAALTSAISNSDAGTLIDRDLLIKILRDPKTIEHLLTSHGASSNPQNVPPSSSSQHGSSSSSSMHNMPSSSLQTRPAIGSQNMPSSSLQTRPAIGSQNMPSSSLQARPAIGSQNMPSSSLQTRPAIGSQNMPSSSLQNRPAIGSQNMPSSSLQTRPTIGSQNMPSTSTQYSPHLTSVSKKSFDPVNIPIQRRDPLSSNIIRPEFIASSIATTTRPFYPPSRIRTIPSLRPSVPDVISAPSPAVRVPITKDINYYKSLIQQHGGEKRELIMPQFAHQSNQPFGVGTSPEPVMNSRDTQPKIMRPCIYFNSSRGCRNGANCVYQHNLSSSQKRVGGVMDVQNAKRMKLDKDITGT